MATASVLAATLLSTSWAWGANGPASNAPDTQTDAAKAFVAQGVTLFREHRYEEAQAAFARAYELDPQAETLLELGLAELEATHPVEASQHLRAYLGRSDAPAAKADVVRSKWLPQAEAQTARLDVFARASAEIRVDGAIGAPATPPTDRPNSGDEPVASFTIAAGEHDVSAREGALVQSLHVIARGGEEVDMHFQRVPDAPPPASASSIDASAADATGRARNSRAKWITGIGLESGALIAAGVAIGFSVAVERTGSDANDLMQRVRATTGGDSGCLPPTPATQCAQVSRDRQAERTDAGLANGFYVGAGALAVIGVATFFLWPSKREASGSVVLPVPLLGDRSAGLAAMGVW